MRPCSSRSRAKDRYTRKDIEELARKRGIKYKNRTMDDLCIELGLKSPKRTKVKTDLPRRSNVKTEYKKSPKRKSKMIIRKKRITPKAPTIKLRSKRFGDVTLHGMEFDILKSALQKYIRRGECEKAIWSAIELDWYRLLELNENEFQLAYQKQWGIDSDKLKSEISHAKANRTNLINRLRVIVVEDIGMANPLLPIQADKLLSEWESGRQSMRAIVNLTELLCRSPKSRFLSDLKGVYFLQPMPKNPQAEEINKLIRGVLGIKMPAGDGNSLEDNFSVALDKKSLDVFYWVRMLYLRENSLDGLVKWIQNYIKNHTHITHVQIQAIDILFKWYKKMSHQEKPLYLYEAILIILYHDWPMTVPPIPDLDTIDLYNKQRKSEPIQLEDYIFDIHTKKGRITEQNLYRKFAFEGSYVVNQDPRSWNELFRIYYITNKLVLDFWDKNKQLPSKHDLELMVDDVRAQMHKFAPRRLPNRFDSESTRFSNVLRAQLTCASYRSDVYFATDNVTGQQVVVKGPLNPKSNIGANYMYLNEMKKLIDFNPIHIQVVELYPDLWEQVGLGIRNKLDLDKKYDFLIMQDVCHLRGKRQLDAIEIKSSKLWPETHIYSSKLDKNNECISITEISPKNRELSIQLLLAYAFRYIFKISDTCERNFMVNKVTQQVFSLDEDTYGERDYPLLTGPANRAPSKKFAPILNEMIRLYGNNVKKILDVWVQKLKGHADSWVIDRIYKFQQLL